MNKSKSVKCKICGKKYVSKQSLIDHIEKSHASNIPEGWNAARYENFLRTGKTEGRCVYCHKETGWNDATGKYNRMCGSEKCKKVARDNANKNYIGLHGKPYSINNPEQQTKMIYSRKNSGKYVFEGEDGKKYVAMYDSSYGRDFFEMIDTLLSWDGSDIIAPSPHTYWYEYEGKKHFYIPDAYSTSLNLEIEFKDGGDNPNKHPKIQAIDKVKEQKKDEVMESLKGQVNYIKICNKDYTGFFAMLSKLREKDVCQLPKWESKLESITESYLSNDLNWATCFGWYHLEKEKKEYTGWDEEQYFKDLDYAIRQELSELSLHQQKGQATRYVYTLGKENRGVLLGIITFKWYDYWDHIDPQYEYYWETQEEVNLDDIDTEKNPVLESTYEKTSPSMILSKSFLRRQYKLRHPLLNYDDLMEMYRKKLFHENLTTREWQVLYNELINVREYLKKVINGNSEEDKRMNYEAKKALKQVESFIQYMEEKNTSKKPINESYVMENSNYRDYMIHGNFDYIKQRLKNMNSPLLKYTSMYDTFNVYDGIPKNMDKNTLEIQVDNVGEEIYKNYWLKNKGTKANMYAPFKFYSDCHNLASYCNIYDKYYKTTSLFNKPSLYFYNFEKNHRRYSVVIATNDKEYDVYLVVNYDLLKISTGNVVNESIELENVITENTITESINFTSNIYSCFAGVGKNFAINKLKEKGYRVDSIEKFRDFYEIYPNTKVDFPKDIKKKSFLNDILFIPYFLEMDKRFLRNSGIDYTIIYPDKKLKSVYIGRFKELGFTKNQIDYLSDNFNDMIDDIEKSKCRKVKLSSKDEYCLDTILLDLDNESLLEGVGNISTKTIEISNPEAKKYMDKSTTSTKKHFDVLKSNNKGELIIDASNDKLIGHVFVGDKKDKGFISNLWVSNDYRNQGYGSKLLHDAMSKYNGIDLTVKKTNDVAINMYKKAGFTNIKFKNCETNPYYWMKLESKITKEDTLLESIQIFQKGDLSEYAQYADLDSARGPIEESGISSTLDKDFKSKPMKLKNKLTNDDVVVTESMDTLLEGTPLETLLTTNPFEKEMTLYHGTYKELDIIKPNSFNGGTKLSKNRMSSFWGLDYNLARMFAFFRLVESMGYMILFSEDDGFYVKPKDYESIMKELRNKRIYIYKKKISKEYIGIGHSSYGEEFTVDLPVKPDKVFIEKYDDFKDIAVTIKLFPSNDDKEIKEFYKPITNEIISKKVDIRRSLITKSFEEFKTAKKKARKLQMSNESVDIFDEGHFSEYREYADLDSARGPIEESGISSTLDKDFKSKPRKSLNSFTKKRLTKPMIDEASKDSNLLRHLDPFDDNCFGFYDGNKLACYVSVNKEKDGINWITALEVMPEYRGCGLSKQLLDFATKVLRANALGVSKSNEVALSLYKNYGFKISKESEKEVQSGKRNNYRMYYGISVESSDGLEPVAEATSIEAIKDDTRYYPVFIFLSYTGTNMAKLIKAFTHDPYAHSSLSFDTELNHMISFNRDGMVDENIFESVYKKNAANIRYSLYVYMATADEYEAMREFVNTLLEKRSKLKYNMLGLTNFIFGRGSEREDKFFCSEFVASVISAGNNKVVKTRPYMTSPYMLAKNKNFVFIKTGILKNYDSKIVDKIVAEKLEEGGFTNVTFK